MIKKEHRNIRDIKGICTNNFSTSKLNVRLNRIKYDRTKDTITMIMSIISTNHFEAYRSTLFVR